MPYCNPAVSFSPIHRCVVAMLVLLSVWSCSRKPAVQSEAPMLKTTAGTTGSLAVESDLAATDQDLLDLAEADPRARLIESEAELTIEAKHQDSLHRKLVDRTKDLGGYVAESSRQRTQVRVPAAEFDTLLAEMETWGKIARRVIKGDDVTGSFRDLKLQLDNAERRKARLLELLAHTDDVETALRIEADLESVNLKIDMLTARLAGIRHDLKFSTVTLETTKPAKDWKPGYVLEGLSLAFKGVRSLLIVR